MSTSAPASPAGIAAAPSSPEHGRYGSATKNLKIGHYRLGRTIGIGTFSKVKLAFHEITGHEVAVKILNRKKIKSQSMDAKIRREIQILKMFRHPHIIKLYEVIETPTDIFMIMEYMPKGELFDYIVKNGKLSEDEARKIMQQIISGVEYCHRHMVVHRDLKPENLLLSNDNQVKIADFGLSNLMRDGDFLSTSCGSPNYAAPEVISGQMYAGAEVDVWSCGVILFALLCARLPFDDDSMANLFVKIRSGVFVLPEHFSPECKDIISQMLIVDPLKRITIAEIRQHPWFNKNLPAYLAKPPPDIASQTITEIDNEVLEILMSKFLISREKATEELRMENLDNKPNQLQVAYHLIYDNRTVADETVPRTPPREALLSTSPPMNLRDELPFIERSGVPQSPHFGSSASSSSASSADGSELKQMWRLGIASGLSPKLILQRIMSILKRNNFEWKVVAPYRLRCRIKSDDVVPVKIMVQLFQVRTNMYLLDFKRIEGDICPFVTACSQLFTEFQALTE